jgi:hypothetical protein
MGQKNRTGRLVSFLLALNLLLSSLPGHSVFAVIIATEAIRATQDTYRDREHVRALLDRKEVQSMLSVGGIYPAEAKKRVDSLADAQVMQIANKIEQLPPGGSFAGSLVYVALVAMLVLLITELLGYTDILYFLLRWKHVHRNNQYDYRPQI